MAKGPPASKTMVCSCNEVTNDRFNRKGKEFINVKDGEGKCRCVINNSKTGKETNIQLVDSVLLAQRTKKK